MFSVFTNNSRQKLFLSISHGKLNFVQNSGNRRNQLDKVEIIKYYLNKRSNVVKNMSDQYICSAEIVNKKMVEKVSNLLPDEEKSNNAAAIFKALGDPTRLRILQSLNIEELCVCDISGIVGLSMSAISHQLRLLRNMHIVKNRRQGKMIYYSLADNHISELLQIAEEHANE
jgi:DNA-binding transcriptional ArsR family regulator